MTERLPFACVPRWIVGDPRFTNRDVRVLAALTRWSDLPDGARPSQAAVAEAAAMTRSSVQRGLDNLVALGIVDVEPRYDEAGGRLPNRYGIRPEHVYTDDPPYPTSGHPPPAGGAPPCPTSGHPPAPRAGRNENEDTETQPTLPVDEVDGSSPPDPDRGFDDFWQAYPRRNGRRVGKQQTRDKWRKLSYPDKRNAYRAARKYADAVSRGETIAKDPARFLQADFWRDWLDDAVAEPPPTDGRKDVDPKRYAERMTEPGPVPGTKRGIL